MNHLFGYKVIKNYLILVTGIRIVIQFIFLHGFGSSASSIHPDTKLLDKYNVRLFAINRPGYGDSDVVTKYSMEDFADSLNEFLIAKGIKKVSFIGWSAGGLYSQVFTDKYSEKVTSLNLVSSAIPLNSK